MNKEIIRTCKTCIETNNLDELQAYYLELMNYTYEIVPDWPTIFHRVYLHACLKGKYAIAEWLEQTIFPKMDPIQQIGLRQIFSYGRHLLSKAQKVH
jgi:hypothetical protein